jgi:molybdopterin-binding protein
VIRLERLRVRVGTFDLHDISLEVPTGGYALIIGPTGSGKTTLLDAIAGHARLLEGRIWVHGEDVTARAPEYRRLGIVYQQYHLFPHLSVGENIAYGLARNRNGGAEEATQRVRTLAALLGITPLLSRRVRGLSGGEQQRVAIARALAPRPSMLLLDEPFAAVDPATRMVLRRELRALHETEGITTLQVTHDFDDALRLGDMVAVMAGGAIVQQGRPEEVFRLPNSAFVARFIGTGNVIKGHVHREGELQADGRYAARFESGGMVLHVIADREGEAHAVIRPEDLLLSASPLPTSIRNRLEAVVERVESLGPVVQVQLDAGRELVAAVTTATATELGLRPGLRVWLGLKATAVHLV